MKGILILLLVFSSVVHARDETGVAARLARANADLSAAVLSADAHALQARYAPDAMLMPEHAQARRGQAAIGDYYAALFQAMRFGAYQRMSRDIVVVDHHAVQIGTYRLASSAGDTPRHEMRGKFMALWDLRPDEPLLVCELWGADVLPDRATSPAPAHTSLLPPAAADQDATLALEIAQRNALINQLVTQRRGGEHADLFLADAIYLPYYTPMRAGIAQIRDYFLDHERPGDVTIEALDLDRGALRQLRGRDVVLEEGFYRVAWRAGDHRGVVHGKSLNLWKRDAGGELRLWRQAVNHD